MRAVCSALGEELANHLDQDCSHADVIELYGLAETVGNQFDRLVGLERDQREWDQLGPLVQPLPRDARTGSTCGRPRSRAAREP
jgi:hypothetical protein